MDVIQIITYIVIPTVSLLIIPVFRSIFMQISELRKDVLTKVNDQQVRQLIADKTDPIREDIQQLNSKLDNIIDLLLTK